MLFQRVTISLSSFSSGTHLFFCSSRKIFIATLLLLKNVTISPTLLTISLNSITSLMESVTTKFKVWAKHGKWVICRSEQANFSDAALSVTIQITLRSILNLAETSGDMFFNVLCCVSSL